MKLVLLFTLLGLSLKVSPFVGALDSFPPLIEFNGKSVSGACVNIIKHLLGDYKIEKLP